MAQLVVRNLPEAVKDRLKQRAKRHGRSLESEVREILVGAASASDLVIGALEQGTGLGSQLSAQMHMAGLDAEEAEEFDDALRSARRNWRTRPIVLDK